ncbi:hypothetical protein NE237_001012 [Protea cynaroides]|uniref:Uncharacterized protein n=1 Tax=Protea cynaroides TaxID=273540 RepID=A0A9Q0KTC7_9MAGN|nr:hypothetical protein NE237_001012 [Protea cynaroides]
MGSASIPMSDVHLSSCNTSGADKLPRVSLPIVVCSDTSHLLNPPPLSPTDPHEPIPMPKSRGSKRPGSPSGTSPSLSNVLPPHHHLYPMCCPPPSPSPSNVLPPPFSFLDHYAIPPHVLQNLAFTTAVLQLLPRFSNISLHSPCYPAVPPSSLTSLTTLFPSSLASASSPLSSPMQVPSLSTSPVTPSLLVHIIVSENTYYMMYFYCIIFLLYNTYIMYWFE